MNYVTPIQNTSSYTTLTDDAISIDGTASSTDSVYGFSYYVPTAYTGIAMCNSSATRKILLIEDYLAFNVSPCLFDMRDVYRDKYVLLWSGPLLEKYLTFFY